MMSNLQPETPIAAEAPEKQSKIAQGEVMISHFLGFNDSGQPMLELPSSDSTMKKIAAQTTVHLRQNDSGRQVVVMFLNQDMAQPIITGLVRSPLYDIIDNEAHILESLDTSAETFTNHQPHSFLGDEQELKIDGKKVRIEGSEEIVLKCGASSITLTKAGKILIRGKYLLNRSSGLNRIMGGSVQVN